MKALVTGGTGFIGQRVTQHLLQQDFEVRCLVRETSNTSPLKRLDGVELVTGSLSDERSLEAAVTGCDYIFHLAGAVIAVDRAGYFRANRDGTVRLARATRRACPQLRRFVYVSSLAAGGPGTPPAVRTEADPDAPITFYGKSKLAAERMLSQMNGDLPITVIRPPSVYGPGDTALLPFFRAAARGIGFRFAGPELYLSLIHVDDVAEALLTVASSPAALGKRYYISDGVPYTLSEVQATIAAAAERTLRLLPVPRPLAPPVGAIGDTLSRITGRPSFVNRQKIKEMLQPGWCCSPDKLERETEFTPQRPFAKEGAAETLAWYRLAGWL